MFSIRHFIERLISDNNLPTCVSSGKGWLFKTILIFGHLFRGGMFCQGERNIDVNI